MPDTPTFDPRIQTEKIAFDEAALVTCEACGRANPPNRLKCLYCGQDLPISSDAAANVKLMLRPLELWERGFNLIVREVAADPNIADAARTLSLQMAQVEDILKTGMSLPVGRVDSENEANILRDRLAVYGIVCSILSDDKLAADKPPVRLSGLKWADDDCVLIDFNTGAEHRFATDEFALIVSGAITVDRLESREKKGRGGKSKLLDESSTMSDETVLDIYTRKDPTGFRVRLNGFDFSCLGKDKGLSAGENIRVLTTRLVDMLPEAKFVDDYHKVRDIIGRVWELESERNVRDLRRSGLGKVQLASTASSNNLNQLTKFSRLQWHLL